MTLVPVTGAVIVRTSMLGDEVDLRSAFEPVLRGIGAHLHVYFFDRVHVGGRAERAAAAAITAVDAVDVDRLAAAALDGRDRRREAAAKRFLIVGLQLDAGKNFQQRDRVASANGQIRDLLRIEDRLMRRDRGVDGLADGRDADGLGERADFQAQRPHREAVVRQHNVVLDLIRLESLELGAHGVGSGHEPGEHIFANVVGGRSALLACVLVRDDDIGARHDLIGRIDDRAKHRARRRLRGQVRRAQNHRKEYQQCEVPHIPPLTCEAALVTGWRMSGLLIPM